MRTILNIIKLFIAIIIIAFIIVEPVISIILMISYVLFFFGMRRFVDKKVQAYVQQRKKEDSDK